jgi:D-glycero-D-manno-heptose 1,7-bisphosphate phosphatase
MDTELENYSAYFFDLGGTLLALDTDEIYRDEDGRVRLLPGVAEKLGALRGQRVFVVTNQGGVGLGHLTEAEARGFIEQLDSQISGIITDYRVCMHRPDAGCGCRKPLPGLVLDLAATYGVDLARAVMIGDGASDEGCARAAGVGNFVWAADFFGWLRPQ